MSGQAHDLKKELSELVQAQAQQARELQKVLSEQADARAGRAKELRAKARAKAQADARDMRAAEGQKRLVTVFTVISGVFLPLGFFSAVSTAFTGVLIFYSD